MIIFSEMSVGHVEFLNVKGNMREHLGDSNRLSILTLDFDAGPDVRVVRWRPVFGSVLSVGGACLGFYPGPCCHPVFALSLPLKNK